jgi:uncharacterized protein YprB with RNaseH-like and TPR domain
LPQPKILLFDLETAGVNSFSADLSNVVCFAYKWLGEKKAHCLTIDQYPDWFSKKKGLNDKGLLKAALKIMEEADLIVAHYGERFDRPYFQGRCVIQGLTPPPPTKLRDTWRIARTAFKFYSNRLANIADVLGLGEKKYHKKTPDEWPGWWLQALAGNEKAIAEMAEYAKQDVQTLEQVYLRLRQYDNPHPRLVVDRSKCGICGGEIEYRGYAFVSANKYRRFQCKECKRWGRETRIAK